MTGKEIVRAIMDRLGVGVSQMGRELGVSTQAAWRRIGGTDTRDLTLEKLGEMCKVLGYKVVIVPEWCFVNPDGFTYTGENDILKGDKGNDIRVCKG